MVFSHAILKLMPSTVSSKQLVVRRLKSTYFGFSLIELMIVVSLFGIAASLVTASYLTFERNQRLKSAASTLKNDLRLVQSKAISGDKGPGRECPSPSASLGGWYLLVDFRDAFNTYYIYGMDCLVGPSGSLSDTIFLEKEVKFPQDTKINRLFYCNGNIPQPIAAFYRPIRSGVSFHNGAFAPPDFLEVDGTALRNLIPEPGAPQSTWVAIELSNNSTSPTRFYWVKIEISGEINESKTAPTGC